MKNEVLRFYCSFCFITLYNSTFLHFKVKTFLELDWKKKIVICVWFAKKFKKENKIEKPHMPMFSLH